MNVTKTGQSESDIKRKNEEEDREWKRSRGEGRKSLKKIRHQKKENLFQELFCLVSLRSHLAIHYCLSENFNDDISQRPVGEANSLQIQN
jgi:hypothetical protein